MNVGLVGAEGVDFLPELLRNLTPAMAETLFSPLSPRSERVMRMRFGVGDLPDHTLEEIAKDLAVTRERVRQIEKMAIRTLLYCALRVVFGGKSA